MSGGPARGAVPSRPTVERAGRARGSTVWANGVELGVESFGRDDGHLVLLAGGPTMLAWPDLLCERLAEAGRRVVRYDLRDCGASTTLEPHSPAYTLRDLATDAAALVDALGASKAHLGGVGVGGLVTQVAALDHPSAFSALTLVSTRPVAPGPVDDDLPDHDPATMKALFSRPLPDWTDRSAVAGFVADGAALLGDDAEQARATAARIWDRTPSSEPSAHEANQLGTVFARLDCSPRWRERLGELTLPTLVVHGAADPFFPVGNGEALAAEIPDARLLVLADMGSALPDAAADEVAAAMLTM
jgi:pimeloyl-ACP methyl ester carboxylesterase